MSQVYAISRRIIGWCTPRRDRTWMPS